MLDSERGVVQADGVAAAPLERDELVDRAVAVDDEVRAAPGRSPNSTSGAFAANVFHVEEYEVVAVKCSTMTFGSRSRATGEP